MGDGCLHPDKTSILLTNYMHMYISLSPSRLTTVPMVVRFECLEGLTSSIMIKKEFIIDARTIVLGCLHVKKLEI